MCTCCAPTPMHQVCINLPVTINERPPRMATNMLSSPYFSLASEVVNFVGRSRAATSKKVYQSHSSGTAHLMTCRLQSPLIFSELQHKKHRTSSMRLHRPSEHHTEWMPKPGHHQDSLGSQKFVNSCPTPIDLHGSWWFFSATFAARSHPHLEQLEFALLSNVRQLSKE